LLTIPEINPNEGSFLPDEQPGNATPPTTAAAVNALLTIKFRRFIMLQV